jgi:hypothetical protein
MKIRVGHPQDEATRKGKVLLLGGSLEYSLVWYFGSDLISEN